MKKFFEDIWYNFYIEKTNDVTAERKELLHNLVEKQRELYGILSDEQKERLEDLEEIASKLNCATEKDAFVDGVCFGVRFIFEAMK